MYNQAVIDFIVAHSQIDEAEFNHNATLSDMNNLIKNRIEVAFLQLNGLLGGIFKDLGYPLDLKGDGVNG